jgi:hypothetical protein
MIRGPGAAGFGRVVLATLVAGPQWTFLTFLLR